MPELKLDSEIQFLKGVGPRRAAALARVDIYTVRDLLYYLPRRYLDRSDIVPIGSLRANINATVVGKVAGKGILKGRKQRLEVVLSDGTGYISLIWFSNYRYFEKIFKKGDMYAITGPVTYFQQLQMVHPEIERIESAEEQLIHVGRIVPVYPSTAELKKAGITGRIMRKMVNTALEKLGNQIPDYLPEKYIGQVVQFSLRQAVKQIHYPDSLSQAELARRRMGFDELLQLQYLILKSRKEHGEIEKGHSYKKPGDNLKEFIRNLPFKLTADQKKAVEDIVEDLQKSRPMHRLLQGDVGCGKTVVAILAGVYAKENGFQTAFMAPTELLAEQHYQTWSEILDKHGIKCGLMTGSLNKTERKKIDKAVAGGEIDIVFGTHAVISESTQFANLGLVIIDEQHRFGVMQRGGLISKGIYPDVLVMTATPIPRTLALTLYGDLDITSIGTLPPGRQPARTVWRTANSRKEIYEYLKNKIEKGDQVFIIYPLVEKSEKLDLQSAEEEYKRLKKDVFPDLKLGLVHGRIKSDKRDKTITAFRNKEIDILVATTVIEVGIDIPSATIIVVEHAERFGLSQLHQLRGRVGRGRRRGMAIAVATPPISDYARKRLDMFQASSDGFKIAEADLELRGPGEFFGTRQHGLPELEIANLATDTDLLPGARQLVLNLLAGEELDREDKRLLKYLKAKTSKKESLARFG